MNQYIYFSSQGKHNNADTANSDFSVNFSNPVVIPPYAEIRCVNCRVNPNNNTFAVKEGQNDRLAFSVGKFWIPEFQDEDEDAYNNAFPLFSIKLDEGVYDLKEGTDPKFYLNAQIEEKINEQITNMPNLRNGVSVSVDSSKTLTIKVSPMGGNGYYQIPDGTNLPSTLVDKLKRINSRTTSVKANLFGDNPEYKSRTIELSPFRMEATAPSTDMIPPNQVGDYDVTCDSLVGSFDVDDIFNITTDPTIQGRVLAVAANLPTKIQIFNTYDEWKTNESPANINIEFGANTCRITEYTTSGPDWRGVTLYNDPVAFNDPRILQRCGYFMSPPINWNSLGDWETSNEAEYKLASIFTINLDNYKPQTEKTTWRQVYSCFFDSITGMDCGVNSAGFGAGPFSGTVCPHEYLDDTGNVISYDVPDDGVGDFTTKLETYELDKLEDYLFRVQIEFVDTEGTLEIFNKTKENIQKDMWGWGNLIDSVTGVTPQPINLDTDLSAGDTLLAIETYVAPSVEGNAMVAQIVVKSKVGTDDWEIKQSVSAIFPNYIGFHKLCNKGALDSKVNKPANIRFSYASNAPNSSLYDNDDNFRQPGSIYWAGAYNPIDEQDGFVDGSFRGADYITSKSANLPSNLPVFVFGDDAIGDTDKLLIAQENPNNGNIVEWTGLGDARLRDSGANGGVIMGLDEQGWQSVKTNSFTTGVEFSGNVNLNARDFPQHYLDLPDLAISNHTGVVDGTGRMNRFIAPLDLNSGAGTNNLHTSQNETLVYNDLGNAMEERITNLRIRICDIEGTPSTNLQNYTLGCLEIRENPVMKQLKMQKALKRQENEMLQYQSGVQPTQFNRVQ